MSIYGARIKVQCELETVEAVGEKKILVSTMFLLFAAFVEDNATIVQYGILKIVHRILKSSINNIFQGSLNKILSHLLTHDRSYISDISLLLIKCIACR